MKVENYFLRYAYPCTYIKVQRGEITEQEMHELEDIAIHNKPVSRARLERVFTKAFPNIDIIAERLHKDRWDPDLMKDYFMKYHNEFIAAGHGIYAIAPPTFKDICMVHIADVTELKDGILSVRYAKADGTPHKRNVFNVFVPNAKIGDKVTVHYGYAVELVK